VDRVAAAIRADPLFLGEETLVFPVESVAVLEQEGRGIVLERRSAPGRSGYQRFLPEARLDESLLTAQMMLAAARALPGLSSGAHLLLELPLSSLWGEQAYKAERAWL
jgi:diaminopimelate dehydrogenase